MKLLMKNITTLVILVFSLFLFSGCSHSKRDTDKKIVSVSILPQKYFVQRIAGDDFEVNVLIPPGGSPATYEPTPRQMKDVAHSLVYFRIGHIPFEKGWLKKLTAGAENLKVVDLSEGVELMRGKPIKHGDHVHEGGVDPHIWTSPRVVKHMTKSIFSELVKLNPEKRVFYEKNFRLFNTDLEKLDSLASHSFSKVRNRSFMIYHPAMSYFARDYGLTQVPIELEGKDPSPSHLKSVISLARELGIHVVFVQKQFSTENAMAVAREIDGKVQTIDPLNEDWLTEMHRIVDVLKTSLD